MNAPQGRARLCLLTPTRPNGTNAPGCYAVGTQVAWKPYGTR